MKNIGERIKGLLIGLMYVAVYFAVTFVVQLVFMLWQNASGEYTASEVSTNLINSSTALALISAIITTWIYMIIGRIRKKPLYKSVSEKQVAPVISIMAVCLALGMRFLVTVFYAYSQNVHMLKKSIDDAAALSPQYTTLLQLGVAAFATVVVLPLFEEILFRGIVMGEYMRFLRPWAAIVLQAILFGVAHGVLFQSMFTFAVGIILGIVYYKTGNIRTAALCHGVFNFSVILAQNQVDLMGAVVFGVSGILLVAFSLGYIIKFSKRE